MGDKEKEKAQRQQKSQKERLPGLELASSNSKLHPSDLDRRPVFLYRQKYRITRGTCTRDTRRTACSAPKLGVKCTPNLSLHRELKSLVSRAVFDEIRMSKKRQHLKNREYKITPHRENPGNCLIRSRRNFVLSARNARHCTDRAQT